MMLWRRQRFRGTAAKAPHWEYYRGRPLVRGEPGMFKPHGIQFRFYLPYALHFGRLVVEAADKGLSAYSARSRTAASRVHPTRGVIW